MANVKPIKSENEINTKWLTESIRSSFDAEFAVTAFHHHNDFSSDGFLSQICAISASTSKGALNVVLKLFPENEETKDFIIKLNLCYKESYFYKLINSEDFQNCIPSKFILPLPKVYYSEYNGEAFTLVMEDLRLKGYKSIVSAEGLDVSATKSSFAAIAKIHSCGYRFIEKYGLQYIEKLKWNEGTVIEFIEDNVVNGLNISIPLLEDSSLKNKVYDFLKTGRYRTLFSSHLNTLLPPTLIHGDFWSGQTMCNSENEINIIDWQFVNILNPTHDLASFLLLSCNPNVYNIHLNEVLDVYVSALNENLHVLESNLNFSHDDVAKSLKKSFQRGFMVLISSVESFLSSNKITKARLIEILKYADSLELFS